MSFAYVKNALRFFVQEIALQFLCAQKSGIFGILKILWIFMILQADNYRLIIFVREYSSFFFVVLYNLVQKIDLAFLSVEVFFVNQCKIFVLYYP